MKFLSPERIDKIQKYQILSDKINSALVYLLLRYALKKEYHLDLCPEFIYQYKNKPYFKNLDLYFNLSHCKNSSACILDQQETAVDISDIRKVSPALVRKICNPQEMLSFTSIPEEKYTREVIRLWTKKECFSKFTGEGLSLDFRKINDYQKIQLFEKEKYICAYITQENFEYPVIISDVSELVSIL